MPSSDPRPTSSTEKRWLTIVGIGEDGLDGLSPQALRAIAKAAHVFGGQRHLKLAAGRIAGVAHPWPSPFDAAMATVCALRGQEVCVLASGDPFCHGVGATLARHLPAYEMTVLPAPSAFSLAAARLGWALQEVDTVSLHGRSVAYLRPLLQPGRRVMALTSDETGPEKIAELLRADGFCGSRMTVLEALGGSAERITTLSADAALPGTINPLNLVAIEPVADANARLLPRAAGLDDALFVHDGQITKREIRALTLSALAPLRGQLLWDVGAGSGSVAIEWMLADPAMRAIAIEADPARAEIIRHNARRIGVPALAVVEGAAPDALAGLEPPDAIFIGGGGTRPGVMETVMKALKPGGRLVANAVTLEMEARLLALRASHGGTLTRLSVERAGAVGTMTAWRPAMPIVQWTWGKP